MREISLLKKPKKKGGYTKEREKDGFVFGARRIERERERAKVDRTLEKR